MRYYTWDNHLATCGKRLVYFICIFARTICMFVYDNDNNNHNYVRKNNQNDNQNHLNKIKEKLYDPKHYFATSSS